MKFSFNEDDLFRIEEDELVKTAEGIKACECVVLISENIALIEAKSSAPRIDNEEKFLAFISDIRQKFADSLQLFSDKELKDVVKQWNLRDSNVKVYNEESALENKLIVAYIPKAETQALRLPDGSIDDDKVQAWFATPN